MHPDMFSTVKNPKIMVRKLENEGKLLFYAHFCVIAALLKGSFGPKMQSLKIENRDALQEISFGFLKWDRMKNL